MDYKILYNVDHVLFYDNTSLKNTLDKIEEFLNY